MFHKNLKGENLHIARANAGAINPIGNITPSIIGEFFFDTAHHLVYISNGLTDTNWEVISGSASFDFTKSGQIIVGTGVGTYIYLDPSESDGDVLVVDSTKPEGVSWQTLPVPEEGSKFINWSPDTLFTQNTNIGIYQNSLFLCATTHTSSATFESDLDRWISLNPSILIEEQSSHDIEAFQPIYFDGTWKKAQANDEATLATHFCLGKNDDYILIAKDNRCKYDSHGLTLGFNYVSETTSGELVTTAPNLENIVLDVLNDNEFEVLVYKDAIKY